MREKPIIWFVLIALLLSTRFIGVIMTQPEETPLIYVDPREVYGHPEGPDSEFTIEIKIKNAANLYAFEFELEFVPFLKVIEPIYWEEGPFLKDEGDTIFISCSDTLRGILYFGCTLTGESPGATGDGTLVRVDFHVVEAGESPLELRETGLWDNHGATIDHHSRDGYYYGPVAKLLSARPDKHMIFVGETQYLYAKVGNFADVPLYVKARFEMMHEDGRYFDLWTGYKGSLTTTSYDGSMQWMFPTSAGDFTGEPATCLNYVEGMTSPTDYRPVSGVYIEEYDGYGPFLLGGGIYLWFNLADVGYWEFEDIEIPEGREIVSVRHEVYAWSDYNLPSDMVDMYWNNGETEELTWSMGYEKHLYNGAPAWYSNDVTWLFDNEAKINNAALWIEFFPYVSLGVEGSCPVITPQGLPHYGYGYYTIGPGELDKAWQKANVWEAIHIDAMRLVVEFSPPQVQPNEIIDLDPVEFGPLTEDDVGVFYCSCTAWFSYFGVSYNPSKRGIDFKWQCKDK